jgi:phage repressor protein C with HTH and peptisase S24 domain
MKTIGEQAREFRLHKGWNTTEMARAVGTSRQNIESLEEKGDRTPRYLALLAKAMGVTADDLLKGRYSAAASEDFQILYSEQGIEPGSWADPPAAIVPILAWEHPDDLPPGEFVMIPRLDVHLSAGDGREQVEIELLKHQPQAFRADWIRRKRLKPGRLASMYAKGDSMEPRIFDKDSLVVDTSQVDVVDDGVYALWYDGGERVKRLYRRPGGGLRIKSENPRYDTIELQPSEVEHVRIIGRVVQISSEGGL